MFALLAILALAVVVGKSARRITTSVKLTLLLFIAAIVLGDFMVWSEQGAWSAEGASGAEVIWAILSWAL